MHLWWSLCTSDGVYVPLMEFMYLWWSLCTSGGVYAPLVEFMYLWWSLCTSGGVYVLVFTRIPGELPWATQVYVAVLVLRISSAN